MRSLRESMPAHQMKPKMIVHKDGSMAVWSESKVTDYVGPTAQISWDKDWLYICTDDYEGNAMINISTLPVLRRALARVAKTIASNPSPQAKE